MSPPDHRDNPEAPASPQALVRDLRAQDGALPEGRRRQCLAAGAAVVPALIALLEAALAEDQDEPEGALFHAVDLLGALGEARALDVLAHTFDTLPLRDEAIPLANHVFIELRAAIEELGGQLTAAQHRKFEAADAARRRFVAQMQWDTAPPAAPAWRTPLQATSGIGPRPPLPAGPRKLGRNAPCWCGSGQKYKKCHLPLERR